MRAKGISSLCQRIGRQQFLSLKPLSSQPFPYQRCSYRRFSIVSSSSHDQSENASTTAPSSSSISAKSDNSSATESSDDIPSPPMIDLARWVDTTVTAMSGKVFDAPLHLIPVNESVKFPIQDCFCLLDGNPTNIPDDVDADVKVVMISFRHYGFSLLRSWLDAFDEQNLHLSTAATKKQKAESAALPPVKIIEICFIEAGILSMAKNLMAKSMRNKIETHRLPQSFIKFGGIMDIALRLSLPNIFTGYVFVLDRQNNIRWKASGDPTGQEIKVMHNVIRRLQNHYLQQQVNNKPETSS